MNKKILTGLVVIVILIFTAIAVVSIWYLKGNNKNPQAVQTVPTANNIQKTNNAVNDWKLYQNTDFGYEIKYPANLTLWTPTEKKFVSPPLLQRADFFTDNRNIISVWVYPKDFVNKYDQSDPKDHQKIIVNGYPSDRYDYKSDMTYFITITIPTDKFQYQILYTDDLDQKYLDTFNQMLATFKIQPAASPAVAETVYTNNEFGFQITIPKGYEDYKAMVEKDPSSQGVTYVHFIFRTQDPEFKNSISENYVTHEKYPGYADIFALGVWDMKSYKKIVQQCKTDPYPDCPYDIIGKNDKYVVDLSLGNGEPPKDMDNLRSMLDKSNDLAKTLNFKFN